MLGMIKGNRRGRQRMRWLDRIIDSKDRNLSKNSEGLEDEKWYGCGWKKYFKK